MQKLNQVIKKLSDTIEETSKIDSTLFYNYEVKRGLRNSDNTGVLVGLTKVGGAEGMDKLEDGTSVSAHGRLFYRGIEIRDFVKGFQKTGRTGFEEVAYLLLAGSLPDKESLADFSKALAANRDLNSITKMRILELHGLDIMNILSQSVMVLYAMDCEADDTSRDNLMLQSLRLIAKFPTIVAYAYHSYNHYHKNGTLSIRRSKPEFTMAENFLYMLKGPRNYTALDVSVLDLALVLHAEHGGGNNSTFTIRVTSSSGTDTYSAMAAALASLKGPLHGGANAQVTNMIEHLKTNIKDWKNDNEIKEYLLKILRKEAYDKSGKIYGIGHAVYTTSDPRAIMLKEKARELALEKEKVEEFEFLERIERIGVEAFMEFKGSNIGKEISANVDFYSGFVYTLIGLPKEIYTPLFAMSRVAGWAAHRIEELNFASKRILRPSYKNVSEKTKYIDIAER